MAKGVMMKKFLVLACVLSLLIPAAVLVGCGSGGSPEQVMQTFYASMKKQDATTTWNMLSADTQKTVRNKSAWEAGLKQLLPSGLTWTIGKATVNGNKATVKVTGLLGGQTDTKSMPLIKENGVWKVSLTGTSSQ